MNIVLLFIAAVIVLGITFFVCKRCRLDFELLAVLSVFAACAFIFLGFVCFKQVVFI